MPENGSATEQLSEYEALSGPRARETLAARGCSDYAAIIGAGASVVFTFCLLVLAVLVANQNDPSGTSVVTIAFQVLHLVVSIFIVCLGTGLVLATLHRTVTSANRVDRSPAWHAALGAGLLAVASAFNVLGNVLQILSPAPTLHWNSIAEDWWTIPTTIVCASVLVVMELGASLRSHFRRYKAVLLPAITGLNVAYFFLNVAGTDSWQNMENNGSTLSQLTRTLSTAFRCGCVLLGADHSLKTINDLLLHPNRHAAAETLDGPLDAGSGQWRAVHSPSVGSFNAAAAVGQTAESAPTDAAVIAVPLSSRSHSSMMVIAGSPACFRHDAPPATPRSAVCETAESAGAREVLAATLAAVVAIDASALARSALFGRRPFASVAAAVVCAVCFVLVAAGLALVQTSWGLRVAAYAALLVVYVVQGAGLGLGVWATLRRGSMVPLTPYDEWARGLPRASALLRAFLPSFGSALWQVLVAAAAQDTTCAVLGACCAPVVVLQGALYTYVVANAPLCIVLPAPGPSQGAAGRSPVAAKRLLVQQQQQQRSEEGRRLLLDAGDRNAETGAPGCQQQQQQQREEGEAAVESLLQFFASVSVAFNVTLLVLAAWPGAMSAAGVDASADAASRAAAAFFHAFCAGAAWNLRGLFVLMTAQEAAQRGALLRQARGVGVQRAVRAAAAAAAAMDAVSAAAAADCVGSRPPLGSTRLGPLVGPSRDSSLSAEELLLLDAPRGGGDGGAAAGFGFARQASGSSGGGWQSGAAADAAAAAMASVAVRAASFARGRPGLLREDSALVEVPLSPNALGQTTQEPSW